MMRVLTGMLLVASSALSINGTGADDPARTTDPEKLFKRLDANADSKLSKDEFKKLAELGQGKLKDRPEVIDRLFERLDANKDGSLTPEEFKKLAELRGQGKPDPEKMGRQEKEKDEATLAKVGSSPTAYPTPAKEFTAATEDAGWNDPARKRDVPVRIYAPALEHGKGPFPTIVFSHGGGESREAFGYLANHWAKQGYITVCLTHRGTDRDAVNAARKRDFAAIGQRDFDLRPQDVRFVLDRILAGKTDCGLLDGRVDPERIGLAGQCMGCTTAMALVGLNLKKGDATAVSSIDKRVKAVLALGPQVDGAGGDKAGMHANSWKTVRPPLMVVTGSNDFLWVKSVRADPKVRRQAYDGVSGGPKYHVEIAGAEHNAFTDSEPWYPVGKRDPRHHDWIRQAGTAFFDAYLKNDKGARDWLQAKKLEEATNGQCKQEHVLAENGGAKKAEPGKEEKTPPPQAELYKSNPKPSHEVASVALVKLADKARDKELQVRAVYPKGDGKFPVILFSHYVAGARDEYDALVSSWAAHGYVCLLPDHADSSALGSKRGENESLRKALQGWRDRAVDLQFLLDSLDEVQRQVPELKGKLDGERVGLGGHYIGAHSAGLLAGMKVFGPDDKAETFADKRVRAVLMLSPTGRGQGLTEKSWADMKLPMLVMAGSKNASKRTGNPPEWRTEPFRFAPPGDKYLVLLEGLDGTYGGLLGEDPKPGELAPYVQASTLAFWDAHLKESKEARAYLKSDNLPTFSKGTVTLERK